MTTRRAFLGLLGVLPFLPRVVIETPTISLVRTGVGEYTAAFNPLPSATTVIRAKCLNAEFDKLMSRSP